MSKKDIKSKTTAPKAVTVEPQTPAVVSENPTTLEATTEEPVKLSKMDKLKLSVQAMLDASNALADRILNKAIAIEAREDAFKARREEISTVVKEKIILSKEQRLERRKLRREADLAKATANKHKTIPSKEAIVREKANQERLLKLITKSSASTPSQIKSVGKSIGLEKMAKELEICKEAARLEKTRRWARAHQQKPGKVSEKITKTTKQERVDKAVAAKKSGKAEYEALVAQHEAIAAHTIEAVEAKAPTKEQLELAKKAEKKQKHDQKLAEIRIARMEKKQSEQMEDEKARKMQKVAKKLAIVEKDKAKRKYAESKKTIVPIRKEIPVVNIATKPLYMVVQNRLNSKREPYAFTTFFLEFQKTEKEAKLAAKKLHNKLMAEKNANDYHSVVVYRGSVVDDEHKITQLINSLFVEKQVEETKAA